MEIFRDEQMISVKSQNTIPEIKLVKQQGSIASIPHISNPVLNYSTSRNTGRGYFQEAEYDLAQVGRIRDVESMVSQAFDKKTALMFKEGWNFVGKNPKTIKYIRTRFAQIARASGLSTLELFRNLGTNLIQKSNSLLIKVRKTEASGGKERKDNFYKKTLKPIAAYFPAPAETMKPDMDGNNIRQWQQRLPDGTFKNFAMEDVVHFYFNRKDGFIFGTPSIIPVIDDIRALRKIEENIELLIYQHLFPLFQFKIGNDLFPAGTTETGESEIDVMRREIQYMPSEGGIVTSHRNEITTIGAEGRAIRAEKYLEHFKRRVIAGLGISSVDLGDGDSSNRSTSDSMSRNLIDSVKDFQQIFEGFVDQLLINELLLESTFEEDPLEEDNIVHLKFREIDIATQIKKEAHYADQFNKDVVTHDEARISMGRDPIIVPTMEEQQANADLGEKYPDWNKMRWKMFEEPKLLIQAIDEPFSLAAKAAVANKSIGMTEEQAGQAAKEGQQAQEAIKRAGTSPTAGLPTRKKLTQKLTNSLQDAVLVSHFNELSDGIISYLDDRGIYAADWVDKLLLVNKDKIIDQLISLQMSAFQNAYLATQSGIDSQYVKSTQKARIQIAQRTNYYVDKLLKDTTAHLKRNLTDKTELLGSLAREIFDSLQYRISAIEDVELAKAKTFGTALALKNRGYKQVIVVNSDSHCSNCLTQSKQSLLLDNILIDNLPPFHSHCNCSIKEDIVIQDNFEKSGIILTDKKIQKVNNECIQKMILKLSTMHPEYKQSRVESMAEELCMAFDLEKEMEDD
jgi:hypothetical protein